MSRQTGPSKTFLFDLDMTLVDSSVLEDWRGKKRWDLVEKNLEKITPFLFKNGPTPDELPALLKKQGHSIGVVTSSPKNYAERVLGKFKIPYDCLISGDDTHTHKPDPHSLNLALKKLCAEPENTYYVGDSVTDTEASFHAGIVSIGAGWAIKDRSEHWKKAPDILIFKPEELLNIANGKITAYSAELEIEPKSSIFHQGSFLSSGKKQYALGRYFGTSDPRHVRSALAVKLLRLKNDDTHAPFFSACLNHFVKYMRDTRGFTPDVVIPVPPKPGETRNRFKKILELSNPYLKSLKIRTPLDGLKRKKDISDYQGMNFEHRAQAMTKEIYETQHRWDDKKILIIDDIYASGSTTARCARTLKNAGASEVRVLAFARDQITFETHPCPNCHQTMRIRVQHQTGELFWVCPAFHFNCPTAVSLK